MRRAELCRAYDNLVDVSVGYKSRRSRKTKRNHPGRTPLIVFTVARKWTTKKEQNPEQELPKYLFAYWTIDRKRRLCAIPTDVVCASRHHLITPEAAERVLVDPNRPMQWGAGMITCVVRRSVAPSRLYGVSCRHVLSMSKQLHPATIWGTRVRIEPNPPRWVGRSRAFAGALQNSRRAANGRITHLSFDAQLCAISSPDNARIALPSFSFRGYVRSRFDLPPRFGIFTSRGTVRAISPVWRRNLSIDYERNGIRSVRHPLLILAQVHRATGDGDSGSPAVDLRTGRLIGMHIAGNGAESAIIPAWQLLDPANYRHTSPNESWTLVNPS